MDAAIDNRSTTDTAPGDLRAAQARIAELEAEVRLRAEPAPGSSLPPSSMRLREVEGVLVKQAMERAQGNVSRAARVLGLSRAALYRRLERHGLNS